jgi:hypothetical protein
MVTLLHITARHRHRYSAGQQEGHYHDLLGTDPEIGN